jgi:hypothetical protein
MAYTFRGFGALHYGKRDFRPDGSYVTTLWIVAMYVPVIPLKSLRLRGTGETKFYGLRERPVFTKTDCAMDWTQVLCVYLWFAAEVSLLFAINRFRQPLLFIPCALLLGVPWLLRRRALEKIKAEKERQAMGFSASLPE